MNAFTANDVRALLIRHLSANFAARGIETSHLAADFDLLESGVVADSLGLLEMIAAVEQYFHITVDFESMDPSRLPVLDVFSEFVTRNARSAGGVPTS